MGKATRLFHGSNQDMGAAFVVKRTGKEILAPPGNLVPLLGTYALMVESVNSFGYHY